ncbi:MAG: hypothetical protein LBN09_05580 [Clostridioides sp.]|nr:hypothetical protein [Clostridioides sp.]
MLYNDDNLPYGYRVSKQIGKYKLLKNDKIAGFDLFYDNYDDVKELDKMNYAEKDASILNTAYIEHPVKGVEKTIRNSIHWTVIR